MAEVDARNQALQDQKNKDLAEKVQAATMEHIKSKLDDDLATLRARIPSSAAEALETAKDQKYLRDRQMIPGQI